MREVRFKKNTQYYKFCLYGFFKNLKFFEPFIMLFFLSKGISFLQIGTLYAIRELSINILEIPTGIIADLLGRKKTMMASFLGYIFSFAIFYLANSYLLLMVGILIFSIGDALRTGTHKAMIFDYLKMHNWQQYKMIYYGNTRSWSQFGSAVSSLIAAAIVIFSGNYQLVFLMSIIPYLINFILIGTYPAKLDGPLNFSEKVSLRQAFKSLIKYSSTSVKSGRAFSIIFNMAAYEGYFKATKDYLQPIVVLSLSAGFVLQTENSDHKTAVIIGVLYFMIYLLSSLTSRNAYKISTLFKSEEKTANITLFAGLFAGILSGFFVFVNIGYAAISAFVFIFIFQNIRKPLGSSLIADQVDNEIMATAISVQSLFNSLFAGMAAIVLGFLADYLSLHFSMIILGCALLLIAPFFTLKAALTIKK